MKTPETGRLRSLAEPELEVEAEGREWTRRRLQQRLQEEADALGAFSPRDGRRLRGRQRRRRTLRSLAGAVELSLSYGRDPQDGRWGCPLLEAWGVGPHQEFTPAARRRLAFTVSASGTYAEAAEVAAEWGLPVDDSTLHALAQQAGARAEEQTLRRLETPPPEREPGRAPSELAVLMIDGCQLRYRGPGWGRVSPQEPRVEWHELKLGVFYREEQAAETAGGRGLLSDKRLVSEPTAFEAGQ